MEVLAGLFVCGLALVPLAAGALLFNLWQRVKRLEATLAALGVRPPTPAGLPAGPPVVAGSAGTAAAPASTQPAAASAPAVAAPSPQPAPAAAAVAPAPSTAAAPAPVLKTATTAPAVPAARPSLERTLGARLPVWIGSIAVALAGVFLFKYAIDEGYFGPLARVVVGTVAGLGLLGAAEWLRRRSASVAGGLAAAGIAVLYASVLAATNLYGLLAPLAGGLAMALITAAAVALALRFGPVVVVVGLVGGFLTPALIGDIDPNPWRLFGYLALLQVGTLAVARRRGWWWLGPVLMFGGGAWGLMWLVADAYDPADGLPLGLFALLGAAALIGAAGWPAAPAGGAGDAVDDGPPSGSAATSVAATDRVAPPRRTGLAAGAGWLGVAYAGAILALTVSAGGYRLTDWWFVAILGAGALVLARLRRDWDRLPWLTAALSAGLLLSTVDAAAAAEGSAWWRWLAPGFGALYALGAYAGLFGAARPGRFASLAAASATVFYLVTYMLRWPIDPTDRWGLAASGVAAVLAAGAAPFARQRLAARATAAAAAASAAATERAVAGDVVADRDRDSASARSAAVVGALGAGVVALLFCGAAIDLEHWWLAAGWTATAAGAAWAARWLDVPALAYAGLPLAGLATLRLLALPDLAAFPAGRWPVVNPIVLGFGAPAAALLLAAAGAAGVGPRVGGGAGGASTPSAPASPALPAAGAREGWPSAGLRWLALILVAVMLHVVIGDAFHRGAGPGIWDPGDGRTALLEWSLHALALLVVALALGEAARRRPWQVLTVGSTVVAWAALAIGAVIALLAANPFFTALPVGATPVFNTLLLAYGVPAVLWLVVARRRSAGGRRSPLAAAAAVMAGVLAFALLSLQIRQAFHGTDLAQGATTAREQYSYSLAWVVYGLGLLAVGIARRLPAARYGSLAVMVVAVCKVFLVDAGDLTGLYRVFSFLGLGLSLLGLAFVYQRFVFRGSDGDGGGAGAMDAGDGDDGSGA